MLFVAPLVGAWIEMSVFARIKLRSFTSLPSWERGLKFTLTYDDDHIVRGRSPRGSVD